jgi:hypothetical protein
MDMALELSQTYTIHESSLEKILVKYNSAAYYSRAVESYALPTLGLTKES